jgi:ADP-ribosylglycohydrolase
MVDAYGERLRRARVALEGLSVGDGLGGFFEFSNPRGLSHFVKTRKPPTGQWHFTDDTNMALSIYEVLRLHGQIEQDALALSFAQHYDRLRGYGRSIHGWVPRVLSGQHWREAAALAFGGQGSFGNGGAMRVAPVGAYFADDLPAVVEQAKRSSEITHSHPEGVAGAIAVAVGVALACRFQIEAQRPTRTEFIEQILPYVPESEVAERIQQGMRLPGGTPVQKAVEALGNGSRVTAQDTVPFVLWSAGEYLDNYEEAIWQTASGGGDVDTTCAIVGGIVASYVGLDGIPDEWIAAREPLPTWAVEDTQ